MGRNYDVIIFIHKYIFILRKPRVAIFDAIIKIITIFIKTNFEDSRNFNRTKN